MSTHLSVRPDQVKAHGFVDGSPHREKLHRLYNQYTRSATDPLYDAAREELQMLLRPLFVTSFVIDDLLADHDFFGARAVLISSASSKTAYGLAWQLSLRRPAGPEVVALTSAGNVAFVEGLGCYDRVVTYDAMQSLPKDMTVAYVDVAGDRVLRAALHRHFGDAMRHSLAVGASHWDAEPVDPDAAALPGAKPLAFLAPAQIAKRRKEWGADGFQQRFGSAWRAFTDRVADPTRSWMTIVSQAGPQAVERIYRELLDGRARPDEGRIVTLRSA